MVDFYKPNTNPSFPVHGTSNCKLGMHGLSFKISNSANLDRTQAEKTNNLLYAHNNHRHNEISRTSMLAIYYILMIHAEKTKKYFNIFFEHDQFI